MAVNAYCPVSNIVQGERSSAHRNKDELVKQASLKEKESRLSEKERRVR